MIIATYRRRNHLIRLASSCDQLAPGDLVRHVLWKDSLGLVLCVAPEQIGVAWSRSNEEIRALDKELDRIGRSW